MMCPFCGDLKTDNTKKDEWQCIECGNIFHEDYREIDDPECDTIFEEKKNA